MRHADAFQVLHTSARERTGALIAGDQPDAPGAARNGASWSSSSTARCWRPDSTARRPPHYHLYAGEGCTASGVRKRRASRSKGDELAERHKLTPSHSGRGVGWPRWNGTRIAAGPATRPKTRRRRSRTSCGPCASCGRRRARRSSRWSAARVAAVAHAPTAVTGVGVNEGWVVGVAQAIATEPRARPE